MKLGDCFKVDELYLNAGISQNSLSETFQTGFVHNTLLKP